MTKVHPTPRVQRLATILRPAEVRAVQSGVRIRERAHQVLEPQHEIGLREVLTARRGPHTALPRRNFQTFKPLLHLFQTVKNLVHRGVHAVALLFLSRRSATGGKDSATGSAVPSFDWRDPERIAAANAVARTEPQTIARARALVANPPAALAEGSDERHAAWLVALADLRHRRTAAAATGGTAA